ncbi:hypothetical protein ACQ4M4_12800 [Leptolyngbya sp. AN02str]|uniref:hypothetical protein n=1 Tax=Leptolyngbya sp. AN02str TaxID=3423363 RepID=UPI003D31D8EA
MELNPFGALILLAATAGVGTAIDDAMQRTRQMSSALPSAPEQVESASFGGGGDQVEDHQPISRADLELLLNIGGGIDANGIFLQPIALNWGYTPSASTVRMPFAWSPDEAALLRVQNGHYVAIDFETGAW